MNSKLHEQCIADHFTTLVFPFRHSINGSNKKILRYLEELQSLWMPWWQRMDLSSGSGYGANKSLHDTLDDTWFFLPYVRRLLYPETALLGQASSVEQQAAVAWKEVCSLGKNRLVELQTKLAKHPGNGLGRSFFRITLDPNSEYCPPVSTLTVTMPDVPFIPQDSPIKQFDIKTQWIDIVLCPGDIGLFMWKFEIDFDNLTLEQCRDIHYCLRRVHPYSLAPLNESLVKLSIPGDQPPTRTAKIENSSDDFRTDDLLDYLLAGFSGSHPRLIRKTLVDWKQNKNSTELYSRSENGQVYGQYFNQFLFGVLEMEEELKPDIDIFRHAQEQAIMEFATSSPVTDLDEQHLTELLDKHSIRLWNNWQGMALKDNAAILGWYSPSGEESSKRFLTTSLRGNVARDYFQLYILVLFCRTWLSMTFDRLVRTNDDVEINQLDIQRLWNQFLKFENSYWYSEVTNRPQGIAIYKKFVAGSGMGALYTEMKEQMEALKNHFDGQITERINKLLTWLTILGIPIGLLFSMFESDLKDNWAQCLSSRSFWSWAAVLFGTTWAFAWIVGKGWIGRLVDWIKGRRS